MSKRKSSRIPGFHKLNFLERRELLSKIDLWDEGEGLTEELAEVMVENALGVFGVPLGVATNFIVNGKDVFVPMAVEEPSVIAAASNAARMVREGGGFEARAAASITTAQVEIIEPRDDASKKIEASFDELRDLANATQPELVSLGGGLREIEIRREVGEGRMVVHLHVDCLDAMGANMVNTMAEGLAQRLEVLTGGRRGLRILTNLADRRVGSARCQVPFSALKRGGYEGSQVAKGVEAAWRFADDDPYRAATHNKGIFNGIDALLLACGNDWRAVEAGGHAYAARAGRYAPLSRWWVEKDHLLGEISMPMAVGMVGGAAKTHPTARRCLALGSVESAKDLSCLAVAVGLASNLAALAALSGEGIQRGHMRLHERKKA